jgi:ribosomal protein L12E/L44/L45/RPP1/RPP2
VIFISRITEQQLLEAIALGISKISNRASSSSASSGNASASAGQSAAAAKKKKGKK